MFIVAMAFVDCSALKCVSMNYQEFLVKLAIMSVSSNEALFYLYSIFGNKRSGSCNDINNSYATLCVPDVAKDINI